MMSLRLILLKNKGLFSRIAFFAGIFIVFHYMVIPTLVYFKHGRHRMGSRRASSDEVMQTLMYYKPLDVVSANTMWQVVNDPVYEVYLFSAFFDDRPNVKEFHVRVVAVAETTADGMLCLLWYRNRKEPDAIPANMTFVGETVEQYGKPFQGVIFSCQVPSLRWPPEWVSINGKDSIVPSNLVRVEMPFRPPMLKDITVCVPPSYGPVSETRFTEWIEMLSYLGVTKVTVYDNGVVSASRRIFKTYADKGIVDLRKVTFPMSTVNTTLSRKLITAVTINDCFYRNMMEHSKVIVMGLDELIVPRIHDTYPEMVTYVDDTLPAHPGRSYQFKTVFFWLDFPPFTEDTPFMTVTRYLMRTPPSASPDTERSITDTQMCLALYTHQCQELLPQFKNLTDWLVPVNMNISLLHHYKKCDLDDTYGTQGLCNKTMELAEVDATGTKFVDKVTTQIVETLWKLDLVDIFNLAEQSVNETMADEMAMNNTMTGQGEESEEGKQQKEEKEEELDVPMDPMVLLKNTRVSLQVTKSVEVEHEQTYGDADDKEGETQTDGQTRQAVRQDREDNNLSGQTLGGSVGGKGDSSVTQSESSYTANNVRHTQLQDMNTRNKASLSRQIGKQNTPWKNTASQLRQTEIQNTYTGNKASHLRESTATKSRMTGQTLKEDGKTTNLMDSRQTNKLVSGNFASSSRLSGHASKVTVQMSPRMLSNNVNNKVKSGINTFSSLGQSSGRAIPKKKAGMNTHGSHRKVGNTNMKSSTVLKTAVKPMESAFKTKANNKRQR